MQSRIYVVRNGKSVSAFINGRTVQIEAFDEQEAKDIMKLAMLAKEGDKEAEAEFMAKFDPNYVIDMIECDKLVRSRSGEVFMAGTKVPLPKLLVEAVVEAHNDGLTMDHLLNFWALCLQNPDTQAREDLFKFLSTYKFPITDKGYFIGYKAVYFRGEKSRYLLEGLSKIFISHKVGRKSLENLFVIAKPYMKQVEVFEGKDEAEALSKAVAEIEAVIRDEAFEDNSEYDEDDYGNETRNLLISEERLEEIVQEELEKVKSKLVVVCKGTEIMATMSDMLENDEADTFTDCHTQTMDIRIGQPVTMPREECDSDPNRTCSRGLHIGAPGYVKSFGSGKTKAIIACLVNPAHVVAVPHDYGFMKLRASEYFPYAVCELKPDGSVVEIDTKYFEEDFCNFEVEELEKFINNGGADVPELPGLTREQALALIENRLQTIC